MSKTCHSCEIGYHDRCRESWCDCCGEAFVEGLEHIPGDEENAGLPNPREDGNEYQKIAPTWAIEMDEPFEVETIEGSMPGKEGDYLARGPEGDMWVIDGDVFHRTYKPAEDVQEHKRMTIPRMTEVFSVRESGLPSGTKNVTVNQLKTDLVNNQKSAINNLSQLSNKGDIQIKQMPAKPGDPSHKTGGYAVVDNHGNVSNLDITTGMLQQDPDAGSMNSPFSSKAPTGGTMNR